MKSFKSYIAETYADSGIGKWMKQSAGGSPGWDRYNTSGERAGKCGDSKEGDAYAACLSPEKAKKLGKDGIASFVRRKRDAQKKAGDASKGGESKKGQKPVNVDTKANEETIQEKNKPSNPKLWSQAISKAKSKFDVYPSAYANAWASKWYKGQGGGWKKVSEDNAVDEKSAAWTRKAGKNKEGGLNAKGRKSYERENPGSDLKAPVSAKQAKASKGGKAAKRRKSFCARMGGMKGPMKDEKGKPTRKALALRKWDC